MMMISYRESPTPAAPMLEASSQPGVPPRLMLMGNMFWVTTETVIPAGAPCHPPPPPPPPPNAPPPVSSPSSTKEWCTMPAPTQEDSPPPGAAQLLTPMVNTSLGTGQTVVWAALWRSPLVDLPRN